MSAAAVVLASLRYSGAVKTVLACLAVLAAVLSTDARAAVDTHTIYLNNCQPSGCVIHAGTSNATTDTSDIPSTTSTLSAFSPSPTVWASVVSCVKTAMAPFDVTVTEQRPASGDFFEMVIAGSPAEMGLASSVPGIGDTSCTGVGTCSPFLPNAISFAFANTGALSGDPNLICRLAVQTLASTWALDHVVDATDVMAFNITATAPQFHDAEACGGDCSNGMSPFGSTCTGSGATATHVCVGTGTATQDEVQTLLALFGPAPLPPLLAITSPADGATVAAAFPIETTCSSGDGVQSVAIAIDSSSAVTITTPPYSTTAPVTLAAGTHSILATCTTTRGAVANASASVTLDLSAGGGGKSKGCSCDLGSGRAPTPATLLICALVAAGVLAARTARRRASRSA